MTEYERQSHSWEPTEYDQNVTAFKRQIGLNRRVWETAKERREERERRRQVEAEVRASASETSDFAYLSEQATALEEKESGQVAVAEGKAPVQQLGHREYPKWVKDIIARDPITAEHARQGLVRYSPSDGKWKDYGRPVGEPKQHSEGGHFLPSMFRNTTRHAKEGGWTR